MLVSAKIHAKALESLAVERAKRESAESVLKILATQMDFLRIRVNQLEAERAVLLQSITKLPMPVANLVMTPTQPDPQNSMPYNDWFTDLGTEDAPKTVS